MLIPRAAREAATRLLAEHDGSGRLVGINPGAGRLIKEWPPERFAAVAAALAADDGATIVLLGAEGDRAQADGVRQALPSEVTLIDIVGQVPLLELAAVLTRLAVLITGDTGPAHLAAAVDTPVVAIFGPTDPNRYRAADAALLKSCTRTSGAARAVGCGARRSGVPTAPPTA